MLRRNSRNVVMAILLPSLQVFALPVLLDGGGRREISPYQPNSRITTAKVSAQKRIADGSMTLTFTGGQCANVGLAYFRDDRIQKGISHSLVGFTADGVKTSIDFSVIERMSIVQIDESPTAKKALIKVSAFPMITPTELVNTRPTYSELVAKYRRSYEIWVETKNNRGTLSLTSTRATNSTRNDLCAKLESIPAGSEMSLAYSDLKPMHVAWTRGGLERWWEGSGRGLWWAIPSVTADVKYPYRRPIQLAFCPRSDGKASLLIALGFSYLGN